LRVSKQLVQVVENRLGPCVAASALPEFFECVPLTAVGPLLLIRRRDVQTPCSFPNLDIPSVKLPKGAGSLRVIVGHCEGHRGPTHTFTPINVWDMRLNGGSLAGPIDEPVVMEYSRRDCTSYG
jgi:hypothetical protein